MGTLLAIAAGGALGAVARYGLGGWIQRLAGGPFPWGTFVVNASGSLVMGFLVVWLRDTTAAAEVRAFLTVGLLGGYTTFSAFSYETVAMLQDGDWARAASYALGSLAVGIAAVVAGMAAAQALLRASH